jgi:uncharacterized membrane protein
MKSNLGFFIGLLIVTGLLCYVPAILAELVKKSVLLYIILTLASSVISILVGMGVIKITLKFCDNEKGELADLFSCFPLFFKYLFGSILYGLILFGGIILLIIPGIIWAIKFQFYNYFIIDKGLGPIEALKRSSAITSGTKWNLFLFDLLLGLIYLLGFLCLLIGLFAAVPTFMVAQAFVYRKLLAQIEITQLSESLTEKVMINREQLPLNV